MATDNVRQAAREELDAQHDKERELERRAQRPQRHGQRHQQRRAGKRRQRLIAPAAHDGVCPQHRHDACADRAGRSARQRGEKYQEGAQHGKTRPPSNRRAPKQRTDHARDHAQVQAGDRQDVRRARQAHGCRRLAVQAGPVAQHDALKQRRLPAKEHFNLRGKPRAEPAQPLARGKPALAPGRPARQQIAGKLVPVADRPDAPVHPAFISRLLRRKEPSRALHTLADQRLVRRHGALRVLPHQRDGHGPGRRRFAVHRHVREHHAVRLEDLLHRALDGHAGRRRRIALAQRVARAQIAQQQHAGQQTKKRALSPQQAHSAPRKRKRAEEDECCFGKSSDFRQEDAQQICGCDRHQSAPHGQHHGRLLRGMLLHGFCTLPCLAMQRSSHLPRR